VPVISTRISGSIGMLGEDYPGYFPVGNSKALAKLLFKAESDITFYGKLERLCAAKARFFKPMEEKKSWKELLRKLVNGES